MPPKRDASPAADVRPDAAPKKRAGGYEKAVAKALSHEAAGKQRDQVTLAELPSEARWRQILAVHLVSEPKFIRFMRNPQPLPHVSLRREWLAAVHLPGRYKKYKNFHSWYGKFWRYNRMMTIERAANLFTMLERTEQQTVEGTLSPLPKNDDKTREQRSNLFKFQMTRQRLLEWKKSLMDTEFGLARDVVADTRSQHVIKEFNDLVKAKARIEIVLSGSPTTLAGVAIIDECLAWVPADHEYGILYSVEKLESSSVSADDLTLNNVENTFPHSTEEEIATTIQDVEKIKIDFLEGGVAEDALKQDVFYLSAPRPPIFDKIQNTKNVEGRVLLDLHTFIEMDRKSSEWLEGMSAGFNQERFKLNFRDFERLISRPAKCVEAAYNDKGFWSAPAIRLDISRDNIVHVRRLVVELVDKGMIANAGDDRTLPKIQILLRRMYALLALIYGCVADGAILLTLMDHLLEQMAKHVIGPVDPKLESVRMEHASALPQTSIASSSKQSGDEVYERMEKEHRARMIFSEIVLFYRGAVFTLFSASAYRKAHNRSDTEKSLWYEGLKNALSVCSHPACAGEFHIEAGAEIPGISSTRLPVTTAVLDDRHGFPEARSSVSTNRPWAYNCVTSMISDARYHVGLVPFYHYFAHLWHWDCKPSRGKPTLLEDITVSQRTEHVVLPEMSIR